MFAPGQRVMVLDHGKMVKGVVAAVGISDSCPSRDLLVKVDPKTKKEKWIWPEGRSLDAIEIHEEVGRINLLEGWDKEGMEFGDTSKFITYSRPRIIFVPVAFCEGFIFPMKEEERKAA